MTFVAFLGANFGVPNLLVSLTQPIVAINKRLVSEALQTLEKNDQSYGLVKLQNKEAVYHEYIQTIIDLFQKFTRKDYLNAT